MIRSVLLAAASAVVLGSVAMAADLPSAKGPPVYVPPPPPVFSWTGLYVGAQVGYEWGRSPSTEYPAAGGGPIAEPTLSDSGIVGGGHIGYNYQMSQFVVGVEGDMNGSGYSGSGTDATGLYGLRTRIPIDGSVRGRVGVAFDRALIYATGGAALGNIHSSITNLGTGAAQTVDALRVGWTVGGGVEYAIDNNWSVRAEYRYTDYGSTTWGYGFPVLPVSTNVRLHETDSRAQAGFSYKFGWAPPPAPAVVSKY